MSIPDIILNSDTSDYISFLNLLTGNNCNDILELSPNRKTSFLPELSGIQNKLSNLEKTTEFAGLFVLTLPTHQRSAFLQRHSDNDTKGEEDGVMESELKEAFSSMDTNGDGLISATDLQQVLNKFGDKSDANELVREADFDGDNFVNFQDFIKMFLSD
ncbi:calmodulin-like 3 [Nowakowskiella sp. JEL0078]|nr:calmodulin-like 3 [Nowakowskiella sp. JEL0078]